MSTKYRYNALSLECMYCSKEFGLLVMMDSNHVDNDPKRIDVRRILQDYHVGMVCDTCVKESAKGKVLDQPEEEIRYRNTRMHE